MLHREQNNLLETRLSTKKKTKQTTETKTNEIKNATLKNNSPGFTGYFFNTI